MYSGGQNSFGGGEIKGSHDLPHNSDYEKDLIFQTWDHRSDPSNKKVTITMEFNNLDRLENIFFIVTSYRVSPTYADSSLSCNDGSGQGYWDCNTNQPALQKVCIWYGLTCNDLPNCASASLPNPDENCRTQIGFESALRLLLYTLALIFVVIIIAGIIRCIVLQTCRSVQTTQYVREYLRAGSIDRPLNAPPTYDDAMKELPFSLRT